MFGETTPIKREALLAEANQIIKEHEDYMQGMEATEVEQKGDVLVFRGEFFLDEDEFQPVKRPPCLICSNISLMYYLKNII